MQADLSTLPTATVVVLCVLIVAQLALDVVALIDLYRRPADRVMTGNKWIWLAVILLVSTIGAIIYLVVGRIRTVAAVAPTATGPVPTESIADSLYGPRRDAKPGPAPAADTHPDAGSR